MIHRAARCQQCRQLIGVIDRRPPPVVEDDLDAEALDLFLNGRFVDEVFRWACREHQEKCPQKPSQAPYTPT